MWVDEYGGSWLGLGLGFRGSGGGRYCGKLRDLAVYGFSGFVAGALDYGLFDHGLESRCPGETSEFLIFTNLSLLSGYFHNLTFLGFFLFLFHHALIFSGSLCLF